MGGPAVVEAVRRDEHGRPVAVRTAPAQIGPTEAEPVPMPVVAALHEIPAGRARSAS
jgi:hypothetical protein